MAELQLPRRMFKTGCEPCGQGKVNNYFNLHWIEAIKKALELDTDYKTKLEESQFRNIMQMGEHSFSVQFLHYLLTLQLETTKKSELWWTFAGKPIRYAIEDFALVTGLNCNPASKTLGNRKKKGNSKEQVGGEIWKSLFGIKLKNEPTPLHILDILNNKQCKTPLGRFRLALLLIVEGILCPTSGNNYIRPEVVDMLVDIEEFLKYPWGRESFTLTVESVKAKHPFHYTKKSVAVQGFAHAMVLVTVCSCPTIIGLANVVEGDMEEDEVSVEDILKSVLAKKLAIDVRPAKNLNQRGQAKVKPLLVKDRWEESLRFKEMLDPAVDHMLALIADDFPFELNTWTGGVTEKEAKLMRNAESSEHADSNDETLMEEGTNAVNERVRKRRRANKTDEKLDIPLLRQIVTEQLEATIERLLRNNGEIMDEVRDLRSKITNMENKIRDMEGNIRDGIRDEIRDMEGKMRDEIRDMEGKIRDEIRKRNSVNGDEHGNQSPAFMEKTDGKEGDFDEEAATLLRIPRKSRRQRKQPEKLSSGRMPKPNEKEEKEAAATLSSLAIKHNIGRDP